MRQRKRAYHKRIWHFTTGYDEFPIIVQAFNRQHVTGKKGRTAGPAFV